MRPLVILFVLLIAACAYVDAYTTQYVGVQRYPPTDPSTVQVLAAEPRERFDRLGEVLLDISVDPQPPVQDIERKLREEAAKWGANAVYVVRDSITPRDGHKLIAIAIRFRQ
ncbi:MAG TPA: hypothetical protein VFJ70_19690 [Burkholderiales bacterium]|nr:hypothetical protein [Burkholderiales bacterium]